MHDDMHDAVGESMPPPVPLELKKGPLKDWENELTWCMELDTSEGRYVIGFNPDFEEIIPSDLENVPCPGFDQKHIHDSRRTRCALYIKQQRKCAKQKRKVRRVPLCLSCC